MTKRIFTFAAATVAAVLLGGCNIGNAPEPMAASEVKKEVEKLTPDQQIDWYNRSPMPPAEKQKKIAEIREKYGLQDSGGGPSAPGAPNAPGN